jgi:bisphosphoglycerate-independent phosphoglycerate mutase (AlkP superfamily)
MINRTTKEVDVAHTTKPVPFVILNKKEDIIKKADTAIQKIGVGKDAKVTGILADIAPTALGLIGITAPESMTGIDLRKVL